jgi:hypothetical protein
MVVVNQSELAQVEALLGRVLPDPRGFADRVLQQIVDRFESYAPGTETSLGVPVTESMSYTALANRNLVLAAAVGACECWGEEPVCPVCSGEGSAGWAEPDAQLFADYVEPAVLRSGSVNGHPPGERATDEGQPSTEGERE